MDKKTDKQIKSKPFFKYDPAVSVVLLLITFFLSQLVAVFLVSLYPAIQNWTELQGKAWLEDSVSAQFIFILLAEIIAITMVVWFVRSANVALTRIGLVRFKLRDIGWALVAYGLYFLTYLAVIIIASNIFSGLDTSQEQQIGFNSAYGSLELMMAFASLVILPPLAEEIMFRGFLFTSLRAKYKFWPATIITSILFGVAHLQFGADAPLLWVAAIDTFILSCFLCYIREETKSLWPPILLHAIKNCVAFMILFGPRFLF